MKRACMAVLVAGSCAALALGAGAAAFDPEFVLVKVAATCEVKGPAADKFVAAKDGAKCAYGSVVRAGSGGPCVVQFSEGNTCTLQAGTAAMIGESKPRSKSKVVALQGDGSVAVVLRKDFRPANDLKVVTAGVACEALHCAFGVDHKTAGKLLVTTVRCTEGAVGLLGGLFAVTGVESGDGVSVSVSPAGDLVRVKALAGGVNLVVREADGAERKLALSAGDELSIVAQKSQTDPSQTALLFTLDFADPAKQDLSWQVERKAGVTLPAPWADLTVETPELVTPTPVGKR